MPGAVSVKKITPVLFVKELEPCLKLWERLGFQRATEVRDGETLAFAILQKDGTEVMYQSFASAEKDPSASPAARKLLRSPGFLYIEVGSVDEIRGLLGVIQLELEKHTTFYGATEIQVRDPGGHFLTFAEFAK